MSYTIFALKWRPKNFDEIVGQKHIVGKLKGAIEKSRLANAYIFAGPRGVGKTSTARILAKALNCKEGLTVNPCGKCPSCIEITQGRSLDVIEIDGASNRGIDEIRTLRENVKFSPVQGKFKIYIIDEVHMLTQEAFNALLKTLEEPPEFVKFIFATTQPHKVIPTILSRCQRCDFRRITAMEIVAQLEKIAQVEKIDIEKEVLFAISKASDGSLRDAESILDQLVSFSKDKVYLKDVISVLGLVEQEILFEMADKIIQKDALAALELFNQIIDEGKDIGVFLTSLIEHFRNLMVAKVSRADAQLIDLPQEICQRLLQQAEAFGMDEIFSAFNILVNTNEMSRRLDSQRIPLEITLVRLANDKKASSPQPLPPKSTQQAGLQPKTPPAKEEPSAPVAPKEEGPPPEVKPIKLASLEEIKAAWQNIVDGISRVKMYVATCLNQGCPLKLESNVLTIALPNGYHKESLERKENKAIIESTASEMLNTQLRVTFILSDPSLQKESQEDHFIKTALETFNGRVIRED